MKASLFAWLMIFVALASAAPLYTTQGVSASGFINDNDRCSIAILDPTGNIIETRTIQNDCMDKDIAYLDEDCYIYPVDGTVTHTIFLAERYSPGTYDVEVRCGNVLNATTSFTATPPSLDILDHNRYPQIISTMKITARTNTEKANSCVARISNTHDGTTTALMTDIPLNERGIFTYDHFIVLEAVYNNYTINLTCDDYSTYETTFKPILLDLGTLTVFGLGLSLEVTLGLFAVIIVLVFLFAAFVLKDILVSLYEGWFK